MKKTEKRIDEKRYVMIHARSVLRICLVAVIALGISVLAYASGAGNSTSVKDGPPEFVDINVQAMCPNMKGLKKDLKSVRHFSHKAHIDALKKDGGFVCSNCHNGATTEKDIIGMDKCKLLEKELDATGGPAKLKNHFHGQCLKCHKELKKEGSPTGPTSCKGCHNRKEETAK